MSAWSESRVAGKQPFPRSEHTAVEEGGKIYIFGGKLPSGEQGGNELHILNTGRAKVLGWLLNC